MSVPHHQIRADFDRDSVVVYQAYSPKIAVPALEAQRFVPPFSVRRMTWVKPSFLWLMARSGWGTKSGQECILAVRVRRSMFDDALGRAVLTSFQPGVHASVSAWDRAFQAARFHVQWDPERSIRGAKLAHRSIQLGIGRFEIEAFVDEWTLELRDLTPLVKKMRMLVKAGKVAQAKRFLPAERVYPVPAGAEQLGFSR